MLSILVGLILIVGVLAYCIGQGRSFYGWLIVGILFVFLGLSHTIWHSFSVFQVALYEHFSWSRQEAALGFSVMAFSHALSGIALGLLTDRFGARKTILIGAATAAVGFVAASRLNSLWQFYMFYGVLGGAGMNAFGSIPGNFLISRWFLRERGVAFGLSTSGVGVGILVMIPLAQLIIVNVDWRAAFLTLGLIFLVVVPPLALLFVRDKPADLGLNPDGVANNTAPLNERGLRSVTEESLIIDRGWASQDWTLGKAIVTRRFWVMAAGFAASNIFIQTLLAHHVAYMNDVGYDKVLSASIAGFVGLASAGGKFLFGWASDYIGREEAWNFGRLSALLGIGVLALAGDPSRWWLLYLYAPLFGMGYGSTSPLMSSITADIFQGRYFTTIWGTAAMFGGVASAFGSWLAGWIFDQTGGYAGTFLFTAVAGVLSSVFVMLAAPGKVRQVAGKVERQRRLTEVGQRNKS